MNLVSLKTQALVNLAPNARFNCSSDEIEWLDTTQTQPTQSEIQAEVTRLQDIYDSQEYARNRATDYPPLEEQLDYIYHNGVEAWKADMILPVKTKHPKGGN